MARQFMLPLLAVLALSACGVERDHTPVLQPEAPAEEPEPDFVLEEPLLELPSRGLELIDTETGLMAVDIGPQDVVSGISPPKFALHCHTAGKTLEVAAPARQIGPKAASGPAEFSASGETWAGEAELVEGASTVLRMTLPLTPELLAAIATTREVRLTSGEGIAQSNADINGVFPGFAGQCSLQSGVLLPPR